MSNIDQSSMNRFPNIELSYGQIDHTKVPFDTYSIIPCGKKCYAWFTYQEGECVCFLIVLNTYCNGSEGNYYCMLYAIIWWL